MTRADWNLAKTKKRLQCRRERWIMKKIGGLVIKGILVAGLLVATCVCTGAYNGPQRLVKTEHKVQQGETLWGIAEHYMEMNTGGDRYILEFIEGIKELNPELVESKGQLQPGQKIRVNYWIKVCDGDQE